MLKLKQMLFYIQLHICFCYHHIFSIFPSPLKKFSEIVINHTNEVYCTRIYFQGYLPITFFSDKGVSQDNGNNNWSMQKLTFNPAPFLGVSKFVITPFLYNIQTLSNFNVWHIILFVLMTGIQIKKKQLYTFVTK